LIEVDQVFPDRVTNTFFLHYRPEQKWHWLSRQEKDELTIFATWMPEMETIYAGTFRRIFLLHCNAFINSSTDCSPHGAAPTLGLIEGSKPRESVEVRMLVFTAT